MVKIVQLGSKTEGFGLTLTRIFYQLPGKHIIMPLLTLQFRDNSPDFPRLRKYLKHWEGLECKIRLVQFAHFLQASQYEIRNARFEGKIH